MHDSPLTATPLPDLEDVPNVPLHLGDAIEALEAFTGPRFATTAERDTKWPSPPNGAECVIGGSRRQRRIAGVWWYLDAPFYSAHDVYMSNSATGGLIDRVLTLPAAPINCIVTVECSMYGGFSGSPLSSLQMSIYSTTFMGSIGSAWAVNGPVMPGSGPGAWGSCGSQTMSYPVNAGSTPGQVARLTWAPTGANAYMNASSWLRMWPR